MKRTLIVLLILAGCSGDTTLPANTPGLAKAVFAGGCFWCMEPAFEKVPGVISATSGYTGGFTLNPTYESVSNDRTGHYESVEVLYDPKRITYAQLLDVYWHNIDPYNKFGQFCDEGPQYRSAIFVASDAERRLAEAMKRKITETMHRDVVTMILPASKFYPAETYHQDYYKKNPVRYMFYRFNCGRDHRLAQVWGTRATIRVP